MPTREQVERVIQEHGLIGIQCRRMDKLDSTHDVLFDGAIMDLIIAQSAFRFQL
jgi:hypothetical protein